MGERVVERCREKAEAGGSNPSPGAIILFLHLRNVSSKRPKAYRWLRQCYCIGDYQFQRSVETFIAIQICCAVNAGF